jgi:hypothetical protein
MMRIFLSSNKVDFSCTLIISIMLSCLLGTKANAIEIIASSAKINSTLYYPDSHPVPAVAGIGQFSIATPPLAPPCQSLYVLSNDKLMQALILKASFLGKIVNIAYDNQVLNPIDSTVCKVNWIQVIY